MPGCLLPALALAASAAGTGMQMAGTAKSKKAMNEKTSQEMMRQRDIQQKTREEFATSLSQSDKGTADAQMQSGETQKEDTYNRLQNVPLDGGNTQLVGGQNASLNVQDNAQRRLGNKSRAKLGSYEKWQLDQAVKNVRAGQNIGILNQNAQRSQAVLQPELQDASHAGDGLSGAGALLGVLGSVMGMGAGLAGTGAGAKAALTAPQLAGFNAGLGPLSAGAAQSLYGMSGPMAAANAAQKLSTLHTFGNLANAGLNVGNGQYRIR